MNYDRIYEAFIQSRRAIEPELQGYTERHHILPRSLGGGDDPENLIRLTPEDHFFAHLLLAKIHGGKLWAPVVFWTGINRWKACRSRREHGWIIRAMARSKLRDGAYNFDARVHCLANKDGRRWSGLQIDMAEIGINRASGCRLVTGRQLISHGGWYLDNGQAVPRQGEAHNRSKQDKFEFISSQGEEFTGTRLEFERHTAMNRSMISRLVTGEFVTAKGWTVKGRTPPTTGRAAAQWRNAGNCNEAQDEIPVEIQKIFKAKDATIICKRKSGGAASTTLNCATLTSIKRAIQIEEGAA